MHQFLKRARGDYFFSKKRRWIYSRLPKVIQRQLAMRDVRNALDRFSLNPGYLEQDPCKAMSFIEVTNVCNLNCAMCNTRLSDRPAGYMSPETFEVILRKLKEGGSRTIGLFTVGEPFLHPDIGALLRLVEKYRFKALFSTNGQFPEQIPELAPRVSKRAVACRFSIDGANQETYESIRQGASFSKLMESLEQIHILNHRKINSRIEVFIKATLCMKNIHEIPDFFRAFGKYCPPENFYFGLIQGLSPDLTFFKNEFPFKHLIRRNIPCGMPFSEMHFTYEGQATLCCRDYSGRLVVGDIRERSIRELWDGDPARKIRKQHLSGKSTGLPCDDCYFPRDHLSDLVNAYISFLDPRSWKRSAREFGDELVDFLWKMDASLAKEDVVGFKKYVLSACAK